MFRRDDLLLQASDEHEPFEAARSPSNPFDPFNLTDLAVIGEVKEEQRIPLTFSESDLEAELKAGQLSKDGPPGFVHDFILY